MVGGINYSFSCNQVGWVLGLPKGERKVPNEFGCEITLRKIEELRHRYGKGRPDNAPKRKGFSVTPLVVQKLMSTFEDNKRDEFKTLFLMVALDMVLCPTQSSRFPRDLLPALTCASDACFYNCCSLVLEKLMESAKRFGERFYFYGFAGGCGGCTLFLAVLYLDSLDHKAIHWGMIPRIKAWTNEEIRKACEHDRVDGEGDFGVLGVLDVAYGEKHPYAARVTSPP